MFSTRMRPVPMRATASISQPSVPDYHLLSNWRTKVSARPQYPVDAWLSVCILCCHFSLLKVISWVVFAFETFGFYIEFVHMLWQFAKTLVMAWLPS